MRSSLHFINSFPHPFTSLHQGFPVKHHLVLKFFVNISVLFRQDYYTMTFRQVAGDPTVQCRILPEGIAIVGETWNFLEADRKIIISLPCYCQPELARHYYGKGFRFYGNPKCLYEIPLFELHKFKVDVCLYDLDDIFPSLSYSNICKFVTSCLQYCVDQMPDSTTFQLLHQSSIPQLQKRRIVNDESSDLVVMNTDFARWVLMIMKYIRFYIVAWCTILISLVYSPNFHFIFT